MLADMTSAVAIFIVTFIVLLSEPVSSMRRELPGRFLVALRPVRNLLLCAKHLFSAARTRQPSRLKPEVKAG
jgi:hypothetical protein